MEGECYGCGDDNPVGLGLDFALDGDRGLAATFHPKPHHVGAPGFLHGGVAATALDETMAAVSFALDGVHSVTATLDLKYRRPVPLDGRAVRIEASLRNDEGTRGRRARRVDGRLVLADGTVAVEATGIFVAVPDGMRWAG